MLYDADAKTADEVRSGWLVESEYRHVLAEALRLEWTATALPDFPSNRQFRIRNEGALVFPIAGKNSAWSWKIGLNHEYQFNPVAGTKSRVKAPG